MSRCLPFPPLGYYRNGVCFNSLQQLLEMRRKEAKAERKRKKDEKRRKRMELEEGEILQKRQKIGDEEVEKIETEHEIFEKRNSVPEDVKQSNGKSRNIRKNNRRWYAHGRHNYVSRTWTDFQVWPPICSNGSMQVPNPTFEFDDHDWLYRRNHPIDFPGTSNNARSYDLCQGNSTFHRQPQAIFFPHVDIYAYPYAIPY